MRVLLASEKFDVNERGDYGDSPLLLSAFYGCKAIVEVLLRQESIDLGAEDIDGLTALQLAVFQGHAEIAPLLETSGAPAPKDFYGFGLLFGAGPV